MSEQDVNMSQYVWIYDKRQRSEYAQYNKQREAILCVLMSTYWEMQLFRTLSKI